MELKINRASNQQGIFIPIIAVLLLSMTGIIFTTYFNSLILSKYEMSFRIHSKNLCRNLVQANDFHKPLSLAQNFATNVNDSFSENSATFGDRNRFRLSRADLILPTMPSGGDHSLTNKLPRHGKDPIQPTQVLDCSDAISYPDNSSKKCNVTVDVEDLTDFIQVGALDRAENAQITAVCRLEARVATIDLSQMLFGAEDQEQGWRKVVATYAYWRPLVGEFKNHRFGGAGNISTWPGIVLAVAPHMTSDATLPQFNWSTMSDSIHSPVRGVTKNNSVIDYRVNLTIDNLVTDAGYANNDSVVSNEFLPPVNWLQQRLFYGHPGGLSGSSGAGAQASDTNPSDLYESLIALANPATLVRNLFTTTFAQWAARHAHMRYAEVLMLGSVHSNGTAGFPVILNSAGSDMIHNTRTKEGFLPGVFYVDGNPINPFGAANNGDVQKVPESIIANQLMVAAHLYRQPEGTQTYPGVKLSKVPQSIIGVDSATIFEPSEYFDSSLEVSLFTSGASGWKGLHQRGYYPTIDGSYKRNSLPNESQVNTIALLGMLGSLQKCPYKFQISPGVYCNKPAQDADLQPDYVALLKYLSGTGGSAIRSPGIFPIDNVNPADDKYFVDAAYQTGVATNWPVVLVAHKAPTTAQVDAIKAFFDDTSLSPAVHNIANWPLKRPIFIVYIPTRIEDVSSPNYTNNITNFKTAFRIGSGASSAKVRRTNYLVTVVPNTMSNEADLAAYLSQLIAPSSGSSTSSIESRARAIFFKLAGNARRKF